MIVMPGFVDTHHHQYETILRGTLADGVLGSPNDGKKTYQGVIQGIFTPVYQPEDAYISELVASLNQLTEDDLARILTEPKDALAKQYRVLFHYDGAGLEFTDGAIHEISRKAKDRGTGARALRSIMENLMLDIMYDLPERERGKTYTITDRVVRGEEPLFSPNAA